MISSAGLIKFNCPSTENLFGLFNRYTNTKYDVCALVTLSNVVLYRRFFESKLAKKYIVFEENFLAIKHLCDHYNNVEFVEINNKNIKNIFIEKADNMKIDLAIMNPPYGKPKEKTSSNLHYDITKVVKSRCDRTLCIQPIRMITSTSDSFEDYKLDYDKDLVSVDEVNSKVFENTNMSNVGIFFWDKNKTSKKISVNLLNGSHSVKSLVEIDITFTDYEKSILSKIENVGSVQSHLIDWRNFNEDCFKYYCFVNRANGSMNSKFQSAILEEFKPSKFKIAYDYNQNINSRGKYVFGGKSVKYLNNLLEAFKRPLLRFTLAKLQDSQCMTIRCYKYIPDIDWENTKTSTDEGILELCGCTKTEAKAFAKYCKNFMDNFDSKDDE